MPDKEWYENLMKRVAPGRFRRRGQKRAGCMSFGEGVAANQVFLGPPKDGREKQPGLYLRFWPGCNVQQARCLYKGLVSKQLLALSGKRGWFVKPLLHLANAFGKGRLNAKAEISLEKYLDYWQANRTRIKKYSILEFEAELKRLCRDGLFGDEDQANYEKIFTKSKQKFVLLRPALYAHFYWSPREVEKLERENGLVGAARERIQEAFDTWRQQVSFEKDPGSIATPQNPPSRAGDHMYGIKLVPPVHLTARPCFSENTTSRTKRPFMNFRKERDARKMPLGHQAILYVSRWKKFVWAIEFLEVVKPEEYEERLLKPWNLKQSDMGDTWKFFRPIRFIARMDAANNYENAPDLEWARKLLGKSKWRPSYGKGHVDIEKGEYERLFQNIPWDWRSGQPILSPKPEPYALPPVDGIERLINHVVEIHKKRLLERNTEDAVKEFLCLLDHPIGRIEFQAGHIRIDVLLSDAAAKPWAVFEVKRDLSRQKTMRHARRQAFDYANQNGARFVVLTDADRYEIYDRNNKGLKYEKKHCGSLRLTKWEASMDAVLDLLRPPRD